MKTLPYLSFALLLVACGSPDQKPGPASATDQLSGKITMSGAFALYPLAVKWGEEFKELHPDVSFDIQGGGAGKGMTDVLAGSVDLGMISREISAEEIARGAFGIAVSKDAVIPTISPRNPNYEAVRKKGVTREQFMDVWITGKIKTWGELAGNGSQDKIEVYTRSDAAGAPETWAKYLGQAQEDLLGVGVFGDPGLADAVGKDPLGIGFNNVNYVYDIGTRKPFPTLAVIPIDVNGNGTLDPGEDFYSDVDALNKAIVEGTFPSPPARPLYFATKGEPRDALVLAFLDWVLGDGQKFVEESGYVQLPPALLDTEREKLKPGR